MQREEPAIRPEAPRRPCTRAVRINNRPPRGPLNGYNDATQVPSIKGLVPCVTFPSSASAQRQTLDTSESGSENDAIVILGAGEA